MERTRYEEITELKRQFHRESMEKLKADASEIITCTHQLRGLHKHLISVKADTEKRSRELDLKEKELQSLSLDLDTKSKAFEAEKSKAGDLKKLVEELRSQRNQLTVTLDKSTGAQRDLDARNQELGQVSSKLGRLRSEARKVLERHKEMKEEISRKTEDLALILVNTEKSGKQLATLDAQLESQRTQYESQALELVSKQKELVSKEKELGCVRESIKHSLNLKKKDLAQILDKIEKSGKLLATVNEEVESQRRLLEIRSLELVSKEEELGCLRESIKLSNSDIELKENKVQTLKILITKCVETINSKSEEVGRIQKLIEQQTSELAVLRNQRDSSKLLIQELSEELVAKEKKQKEILETIRRSSSEMEEKAKEIKAAETKASDLNVRSEMLGQEVKGKEKELNLLKIQIKSEEKKLLQLKSEMEEETHRTEKDLEVILSKIEESCKQLVAVDGQLESLRKLLEVKSVELVSKEMKLGDVRESIKLSNSDLKLKEEMLQSLNNRLAVCGKTIDSKSEELGDIQNLIGQKNHELEVMRNQHESISLSIQELSKELVAREMELECVGESSKRLQFDLEVKEKRMQVLNDLITISAEQLDSKSKELKEIQRELELKKQLRHMRTVLVKHEKQPASIPINDTSQQSAAETESENEDALTHHGFSAPLTRHEVSSVLKTLPKPADFVLEEVRGHICGDLGLQDSVIEILVLFFEELTKIQRPDDTQLERKATQVATLWKERIAIEAPKSSLEALAFLLFIVAYGLKKVINEEETALLASSIAHYEQAPRLFISLSLNTEIQNLVNELIKKSQYIPAVRLICLFRLDKEFSPSDLLKKDIINFRRSTLEKKRSTESSQAKDKDAGRLRAILELVADYKLDIKLPGDLIAKLMIQRENSAPLVRCSVKQHTSSSKQQAKSPNPASAQRSPNLASVHHSSSVNLRVPKLEGKPYLN